MSKYEEFLRRIKNPESGGNPYAVNPHKDQTASGLYQFTKNTWEGLGFDWKDVFDVNKQQEAGLKYAKQNDEALKKFGIKEPNNTDLYFAHFLGLSGYKEFLKHSDDTPVSEFMKEGTIRVNPIYLHDEKTKRPLTVGEVKKVISGKVGENIGTPSYHENITEDDYVHIPLITDSPDLTPSQPIYNDNSDLEYSEDSGDDDSENGVDNAISFLNNESYSRDLTDQQIAQERAFIDAVQAQAIEYEPIQSYQKGGYVPTTPNGMYDYPNQEVIVPTNGSITMKGIEYPIIGTSLETGEKKLMQPNSEYFFKNTKNVHEVPLINDKKK